MTFVTKTHLSRRTMLQGLGVAISLPLLDSMIPALTAQTKTAANVVPRVGFVYVPHGVIMDQWTPSTAGAGFTFTPILKPLEAFRDSLVVVSNLARPEANFETQHAGAAASWLAGVPPKRTEGPDFQVGTTIDQVVAKAIGQPAATRAVARACATNPVAVAIPCHRVVRKSGDMGGYRWGIERKKALLELEMEHP